MILRIYVEKVGLEEVVNVDSDGEVKLHDGYLVIREEDAFDEDTYDEIIAEKEADIKDLTEERNTLRAKLDAVQEALKG